MAAREIKTTISLDGEKEFNQEISSAARNLRVMGSELKRASAEYSATGDRATYLASKSETLKNQIAQQKEIFQALSRAVESSARSTGEASAKTDGYRIRMNNAAASIAKMERELADTDREMEELGRDSLKVGRQIEDGIGESAERAGRSLDEMYEKLQSDIGSIRNSTAVSAITDLGGAITGAWQSLNGFTEGTRDYNRQMSYLEQNAKDAKIGMTDVKDLYMEIVGLTGDVEGAFEGTSNLLAIGFDTSEMELAIESLAGAVIKFPETMKFENLAGSLQESYGSGEATGAFAELMDKMSISTENFAEAMKTANDEEEKQQVLLSHLNLMNLRPTYDKYKETNSDLIEAEKSTQNLTGAMSELGRTVDAAITPARNKLAEGIRGINEILTEGDEEGYWSRAWDEAIGVIKTEGAQMLTEFEATVENIFPGIDDTMGAVAGKIAEKGKEIYEESKKVAEKIDEGLGLQYTDEELEAAAEQTEGLRAELQRLNAEVIHAYEIGDGKRALELQTEIDKVLAEIARSEKAAMDALEEEMSAGISQTAQASIETSKETAEGMEKEWSGPIEGIKNKAAEMMTALESKIKDRGEKIVEEAGKIVGSIAQKITEGLETAEIALGTRYTEEELTAARMASAGIREEYDAIEEEILKAYEQNDGKRALELIARKSELQSAIAEAEKNAIAEIEGAAKKDDGTHGAQDVLDQMQSEIRAGAQQTEETAREAGRGAMEALSDSMTQAGIEEAGAAEGVMDAMGRKWNDSLSGIQTDSSEMMQALEDEIALDGKHVSATAADTVEEIVDQVTGGLDEAKAAMRIRYAEEELKATRATAEELREEFYAIEEQILDAYAQGDGKRAQELIARKQELHDLIIEAEQNAIDEVGKTGSEGGAQAGSAAMSEMQSAIIEGTPAAEETARTAGQNVMTSLANGITENGSAAVNAAAEVVSAINATFSQISMPDLGSISYQYYKAPSSPKGGSSTGVRQSYSISLNVDGKRMASAMTPYVSGMLASSSNRYSALT